DQTMVHGEAPRTLTLDASDADGDPLTYSAQLQMTGLTGLAYQLDQQLGLSSSGDYSTNFQGHQEKWLQGGDAQYFVLPNAELRRWRDAAYSYGAAGLVAKLDATYYADPSKLWDARAIATLAVSGNRLTITPSTNSPGDGTVNVSVSDGLVTTTQTFAL